VRKGLLRESGHVKFFRADVTLDALQQEMFFLAYHLHWSWSELMALESQERRTFVGLLAEQIEREREQLAKGRSG
jgi:hypothetical protein